MEWSTNTKNGYDDLEVYIEYEYVFVSTTGRNHKNKNKKFSNTSVGWPTRSKDLWQWAEHRQYHVYTSNLAQ